MNPLQQSLAAADEAYLIGMSNKGIYKRACKDLESGEISMQPKEDSLEVSVCGEICHIKDPLWESSCSCPSRTVCRHLITAILWLRENYQDDAESPGEQEIPETPEQDAEIGLPDFLKQTLSQITLPELRKALGSHAGMVQEQKILLKESSILSGIIPDQSRTTVKILYPLEYSSCSCHKKDLCMHKAAVILAWQLKENLIRPEDLQEQIRNLSPEESGIIRENAAQSYALLCDILRWGLVRMPDNLAEHLEASAVQSHALKMADAERMLREIGNKLSECRDRRAVFNPELFLQKLCTCADHLENLQKENLSEAELGQFRKVYEEQIQDLEILPVGQRKINTPEYQGNIYYFLDLNRDSRRFLSYSEVRPVFYENQKKNTYHGNVMPWNANSPMKTLMYDKMILKNAKISDGKLSGSKDTLIMSRTKANLDCEAVRELLYTDFRKLAIAMSEKKSGSETDRLCFVSPAVCLSSTFDTHSQYYQMQIADHAGNVIQIRSRYKAEQKKFIELLERIGSEMLENQEKNFVWLCSAYFENGRLHLYPIEVYDFIRIPESILEYKLPEIYSRHKPAHVTRIFTLLQDVQNYLCEILQSGLQSADSRNLKKFQEKAEQFGMYGFTDLLKKFMQSLESSRHAMQDTTKDTVNYYRQIRNYIAVGVEKLEILCALDSMKREN
ncbi:MAG: SWIM zinc finger family protein [Oscillospiraceae bacterium]|nr:SWIM zinc finger family protein [Oscillospiraceae bacterium]